MTVAHLLDKQAAATAMASCDFCDELQQSPSSTFARAYAEIEANRIVFETAKFAVLPTMGQVLPGSLLVVPKTHIETLAELELDALAELEQVLATAKLLMGSEHVVVYEHGARASTGGSCGIYHAHAHLSPLAQPIAPEEIFENCFERVQRFTDACVALRGASQYLVYCVGSFSAYQDSPTAPRTARSTCDDDSLSSPARPRTGTGARPRSRSPRFLRRFGRCATPSPRPQCS